MLNTGIGKQLYRSIVATSAMVIPASSSASSLARAAAGLRDRSGRVSSRCSRASACPARNTHRSSGTPSRRAAAIEASTTAAPWLT